MSLARADASQGTSPANQMAVRRVTAGTSMDGWLSPDWGTLRPADRSNGASEWTVLRDLALTRCRGARRVDDQWRMNMPERRTVAKARKDKRAGNTTTTPAGEIVHEEIRKVRRAQHGARPPQR